MKISIANIHNATNEEWDLIWRECNYSTYFHSREWAEIWNVYSKGKLNPGPKLISFSDGKKALLPLSFQRSLKGLAKNYISSPGGTFGGWIAKDELDVDHAVLLNGYLTKKCGNLIWRLNPYDELAFRAGVRISKDDETHTLNLSDGFDAIYNCWTKGHVSAARKARKEGVSIRLASSCDDWDLYYQVYEDSIRRWGNKVSSRYSWELFQEMFRRNSPSIRLWLAEYQNTVVAGALCFYSKKHVVYWHGAALEKYFNLRPVNLLMYETIKDACECGYRWFDFNPSGGHEGVKSFKTSFGAVSMSSPVIHRTSKVMPLIKTVSKIAKKIMS
jgi:hypothetical protein